jgi:hypothetical protein
VACSARQVDVDSDLYLSAIQCLSWLFRLRLMVPGTLLRYDDWHDLPNGTPLWGEMKAHAEITKRFRVTWVPLNRSYRKSEFQVHSIGRMRRATSGRRSRTR